MTEVFTFNTEELAKPVQIVEKIKTFDLVSEDNPILKQVLPEFDFTNPPVNPNQFASTLVETCKEHKGIGLSANQCGFPYRVFVMGAGDSYVAFYNPKIISYSVETKHMIEGCLSFPMLGLRITRPEEIHVQYQDFNGITRETKFVGLSARCFQHELSHLNGLTMLDEAKPLALKTGLKKRSKFVKKV
jgi:peptide deformylase